MAQSTLEGRGSKLQGRQTYPGLSPAFFGLMGSANLSAPFALEAAKPFQKVVDPVAEKKNHDWQMGNRFNEQLKARKGFTDDVLDWGFEQLTGYKVIRPQIKRSYVSSDRVPLHAGIAVHLPIDYPKNEAEPELKFELSKKEYPEFEGWSPPEGASPLQKMIAQAKNDPEASLFGGGLPPTHLVVEFHKKVYIPAINSTKKWSDKEIEGIGQYPDAGAIKEHRNLVINHFLGSKERKTIRNNFTREKQADGIFLTYGSQQALSYMIEMLVDENKASKRKPVEIAITDPTYPGLLMAAKKFLKRGVLKFRIVPINEKTGEIDTVALDEALKNKGCKAFYLAEGNPLPKKISNLEAVAKVLRKKDNRGKLVFEDRAYLGLGATAKNSLFHLLKNRVVAFETFSKKGTPDRKGVVYSNMEPGKFARIRDKMLEIQYNETLGYSGSLSGPLAAILKYNIETGVFTRHIKKVQAHYEAQRKLYKKAYKEALNLAFGKNRNSLVDDVVIGNVRFMFGWRNTHHVPASLYNKAAAEVKLYSLSGVTCRPEPEYIRGKKYLRSPTLNHLRQNYTWIKPENMQLGIYKDVILQVIFSKKMESETKREAVEKLYREMVRLNKGKLLPEVDQFIQKMFKNNWEYV